MIAKIYVGVHDGIRSPLGVKHAALPVAILVSTQKKDIYMIAAWECSIRTILACDYY
jgi:hypothetical protein